MNKLAVGTQHNATSGLQKAIFTVRLPTRS